MPKYVFAYHGGSMPDTPEEGAKVMAKWQNWLASMGDDVVDGGNPVGPSRTVFPDKVTDNGGANPLSGYSLIMAKDMDDALAKAKGCPTLESGGTVEVAEAMEL